MAGLVRFVETSGFTESVPQYFANDASYAEAQRFLANQPDGGDVIRGAPPLRKLRWRDPKRGKGKRGGIRIIYIHIPAAETIILLDVHGKDESEDLTKEQKAQLKTLCHQLIEEFKQT